VLALLQDDLADLFALASLDHVDDEARAAGNGKGFGTQNFKAVAWVVAHPFFGVVFKRPLLRQGVGANRQRSRGLHGAPRGEADGVEHRVFVLWRR